MMIDIAFEDDGVLSVMIFGGDKMEKKSNLQSNFLASLEVIDVLKQELHSLIFVENNKTNDQRQTQEVKLQRATELGVLKHFGDKHTEVSPKEYAC